MTTVIHGAKVCTLNYMKYFHKHNSQLSGELHQKWTIGSLDLFSLFRKTKEKDEISRQKISCLVSVTTNYSIPSSVTLCKMYEKFELYVALKYSDLPYLSHLA
jgi:hypothetical protein